MGPVRIRHSSHPVQSFMAGAGWQANMATIKFSILWRNSHKPIAFAQIPPPPPLSPYTDHHWVHFPRKSSERHFSSASQGGSGNCLRLLLHGVWLNFSQSHQLIKHDTKYKNGSFCTSIKMSFIWTLWSVTRTWALQGIRTGGRCATYTVNVIVSTKFPPSPAVDRARWQAKWLTLNVGYHDVMHTAPDRVEHADHAYDSWWDVKDAFFHPKASNSSLALLISIFDNRCFRNVHNNKTPAEYNIHDLMLKP